MTTKRSLRNELRLYKDMLLFKNLLYARALDELEEARNDVEHITELWDASERALEEAEADLDEAEADLDHALVELVNVTRELNDTITAWAQTIVDRLTGLT